MPCTAIFFPGEVSIPRCQEGTFLVSWHPWESLCARTAPAFWPRPRYAYWSTADAFDPGQGMHTEALQMLLIPQERLDSCVSVYTLCHIAYGKVKCGSHNHRGLQRGLWICWPKSSLDQRGHRGHRKLAQVVPSGGDRVMRSKSTIQLLPSHLLMVQWISPFQ